MSPNRPIVSVTRAVPGRLDIPGAAVRTLGEGLPARGEVLDFVRNSSVIVSMFTDRVDDELLDAGGAGLLGVANFGVGLDHIDLDACRRRGVGVTNTPDTVTEGTANMAWLLVQAVARRLIEADRYARSPEYAGKGELGMGDFLGMDLAGKTLLIVGAGRIGYATALRARAWSMEVRYVARSRHPEFEGAPLDGRPVGLDEGLASADVVSLHTPLTDETHHLIGAGALARMKPGAILVNTSRGAVVDGDALADTLEAGRLWGAGLDVHECEPGVHRRLAGRGDVVLTPHIGSAEVRFREMMTAMVAGNVRAMLAGERPPNQVSP